MDDDRLLRIEAKLDKVLDAVGALERNDAAQGERIKRIEDDIRRHSDKFDRYLNRIENVENTVREMAIKTSGFDDIKKRVNELETKTAKHALALWVKIGGIALSVAVTAIATLLLIKLGVVK